MKSYKICAKVFFSIPAIVLLWQFVSRKKTETSQNRESPLLMLQNYQLAYIRGGNFAD